MMPFLKHNRDRKNDVAQQDSVTAGGLRQRTKRAFIDLVRKVRRKQPTVAHNHEAQMLESTVTKPSPRNRPISSRTSTPRRRLSSQSSHINAKPNGHDKPQEAPKHVEKEEKVVKVLQEPDLHALYSGAPQFSVKQQNGGRQKPQVSYPWNKGIQVQDLRDCPPPAHPAFSAATCRRHAQLRTTTSNQEAGLIGYDIGIEEVPDMLSASGFEPGTLGFEHFLEIPVSDNYVEEEEQRAGKGLSEAKRNVELLHNNPERLGIRSIDSQEVNERLVELNQLYQTLRAKGQKSTILDEHSSGELYATLFGKFLTPPRFDPNTSDPTGFKVQIETLLKVLKLKGLWFDFSLVEWRIRLGQLIWAGGDSRSDQETDTRWTERETLLLQISLACELLVRLDAVSAMSTSDVTSKLGLTSEEVLNFTKTKNRKVDWDLLLARKFLDDIHVTEERPEPSSPKKRGFFSSITSDPEETPTPSKSTLVFAPRHSTQQLSGLLYFATHLLWPNLEFLSSELSRKLGLPNPKELEKPENKVLTSVLASSPSIYSTPVATPRALTHNRNSYFGPSASTRPAISRENTSLSIQLRPSTQVDEQIGNPVDIGGWLSRTYLTGFVLPGEALPHLLISTLLENDASAIAVLGDAANLYGAFIYAGSSWWSKSCVAGRVLAPADGSRECMGWIRSLIVPEGLEERWLDISIKDVDVPNRLGDMVEKAGGVLKNGESGNALPADFSMPQDISIHDDTAGTISILGLQLEDTAAHSNSLEASASLEQGFGSPEFGVSLIFSLSSNHTNDNASSHTPYSEINHDLDDRDISPPDPPKQVHTISINCDVHFVSAFPCIPPSQSKLAVVLPNSDPPPSAVKGPMLSHPLHVSHAYRSVLASGLVEEKGGLFDEVLVIQCQTPEEQVFARAWCAEIGWHAIVARKGRTCLSCAIREADACGIRAVIRIVDKE